MSYVPCAKLHVLNMYDLTTSYTQPLLVPFSLPWPSRWTSHDLLLDFSELAKLIQALRPPYLELVCPYLLLLLDK